MPAIGFRLLTDAFVVSRDTLIREIFQTHKNSYLFFVFSPTARGSAE
jgi:hypothetical protein